MVKIDDAYVVMSDDGCLIARGATKQRYLLHVNEETRKRVLLYYSEGLALNTIKFPMFASIRALNHALKNGWITKEEMEMQEWSGIEEHLIAVPCNIVTREGEGDSNG